MRTYLGQNFLKDRAIAEAIVDAARIEPTDTVIEIGPGRGILTSLIEPRAARIAAVELDKKLIAPLEAAFPSIKIVSGDALKIDYDALTRGKPAVFIGNLPYCSATAILAKIITGGFWKRAVFMFQREVARRIAAEPSNRRFGVKETGYLTAFARYYSIPKILFDVNPGSFSPPPKVRSSVVEFVPSPPEKRLSDKRREKLLFDIIGAAFSQRRKTLANTLAPLAGGDKGLIMRTLEAAGINPAARAETLDIEDFKKLATVWEVISG
ncbi:MAG: ribosomal RNA small subunit methyltransferase A [Elusimicrobia bacterium HGW-Elusimicrobia-1]|jgi:16S rRNA (adenine1518-N6/adenine1519-N6)-dimethyltransferase|nr:MAG: ribosomal RNA small subunit methyltransferase A [Elusimicrobia bacterium HGW-Elusimicrobia-1]